MTFRIYIDRQLVHTGPFLSGWAAYECAILRAQLKGAKHIQVKAA